LGKLMRIVYARHGAPTHPTDTPKAWESFYDRVIEIACEYLKKGSPVYMEGPG